MPDFSNYTYVYFDTVRKQKSVHGKYNLFLNRVRYPATHYVSRHETRLADMTLGAAYPAWPQDLAFGSQAENTGHLKQIKCLHGTSEWSPRSQCVSKHIGKQHRKCCWCFFIELWSMGHYHSNYTSLHWTQLHSAVVHRRLGLQCSHNSGEGSTNLWGQPQCHMKQVSLISLLP